MAWGNYGPAYMMGKKYEGQTSPRIVPLRQWSDVVFLEWQQLCVAPSSKGDIKGLRYIFRLLISNPDSQALMSKALENVGAKISQWPGQDFGRSTKAFKALLGSPNGSGVAWLLINHKEQLGKKTVWKITVFRHEGAAEDADPSMLLWLEDVPVSADGQAEG